VGDRLSPDGDATASADALPNLQIFGVSTN
jgi:hypothetical protein